MCYGLKITLSSECGLLRRWFLQRGYDVDDLIVRRLLGATMLRGGNRVRGPADECTDRDADTNEFTGNVGREEGQKAEMPLDRCRPVKERWRAGRDELLRERNANPLERFGIR